MPSAARVQWAKIRATVVVVSALVVLGVLVYLLSGGTWLQPKTFLTIHVPDASGLEPGAIVQLSGVDIGKVEWLQLTKSKDPTRVIEVRLKVQQQYLADIPDDSVAGLDSANVLGDQYVDIAMGKSPRSVRPGGELLFRPPTDIMKNIDMTQFDAQLKVIDKIIADIQEGKGPLGQFVASDDLYQQTVAGVANIEKALHAATGTNTTVGKLLYSADIHSQVRTLLRQLDDRLAQFQASPYLRDSAQYDQIRDQIAQLHRTLTDLEAGPWLSSDAAWRDWNSRVKALIASVDAMSYGAGPLGLSNAQTYETLNGAMQDLAATMKDFREHPQKFLRLKIF